MRRRRDWIAGILLALVGVGGRLAFLHRFPTLPFSDFQALVDFALRLRDVGLAEKSWHWVQFNPGLSLILSVLFPVFRGDPVVVARNATSIATGLIGVLPYVLWRGVVAFRWRLLAGLLLALWPGEIFFSGVVAQDNWVLLPTIAVACLAVRHLRIPADAGHPIAAALLFVSAAAIRQEMIVVLFPLLIAASGVVRRLPGRMKRAWLLALSTGLPVLVLCAQRQAATGRFTITTEHGGLGLLGSAVPGAASAGWVNPMMYVASVQPELLEDRPRLRRESYRLALKELERRWRFHAFRVGVAGLRLSLDSDADDLFWSVGAPAALPAARRERGAALAQRLRPWLRGELALIQGLFAAALIIGVRRRDKAILAIGLAVLLKFGIQALVSPISRMAIPAIALELLVVPLAAGHLAASRSSREVAATLLLSLAVAALLLIAVPRLTALLARKDEPAREVARFPLQIDGGAWIFCRVTSGLVTDLTRTRATIAMRDADPAPGETAGVSCRVPAFSAEAPIVLRLENHYERGWLPDRIVERVEIDGREIFRHDFADDQGAGRAEVIPPPAETPREASIQLLAINPDPGWRWGRAGRVSFELIRGSPSRVPR